MRREGENHEERVKIIQDGSHIGVIHATYIKVDAPLIIPIWIPS